MKKYLCLLCGAHFDEKVGCPASHIAPGTPWAELPPNWRCPDCGATKDDFELIEQ